MGCAPSTASAPRSSDHEGCQMKPLEEVFDNTFTSAVHRASSGMSTSVSASTGTPSVHGTEKMKLSPSVIVGLNDLSDDEQEPTTKASGKRMSGKSKKRERSESKRKTSGISITSIGPRMFQRSSSTKQFSRTNSSFGSTPPNDAYDQRSLTLTSGFSSFGYFSSSGDSVHAPSSEEVHEFLRSHRLFATMDDSLIQEVSQCIKVTILHPGDFLFHEGDAIDGLFVVHSGDVSMVKEVVHDMHSDNRKSLRQGAILGSLKDGQNAKYGVRVPSFGITAVILHMPSQTIQKLANGPNKSMVESLWHVLSPCLSAF